MSHVRDELLTRVEGLKLASYCNPLDALKKKFKRYGVSELTGRRNHWVEISEGEWTYKRRKPRPGFKEVNMSERELFQEGRNRVAIITAAASEGISLHCLKSSAVCPQPRRRVNLILEFSWSAEASIQQMGRVHRANQAYPPTYLVFVTNVGGENRFISALTSRLAALGALTRGDRNAVLAGGDGNQLEQMNFDDDYGEMALTLLGFSLGFRRRIQKGCKVQLSADYKDICNAAHGPLKPDDVGTVVEFFESSNKYAVKASNGIIGMYAKGDLVLEGIQRPSYKKQRSKNQMKGIRQELKEAGGDSIEKAFTLPCVEFGEIKDVSELALPSEFVNAAGQYVI